MVIACLLVMFILWVTDIVPYALQPTIISLLVTSMIAEFVLSLVGYFRYWGRQRTIFLIAVIFVVAVLAWFLTS